MWSRFNVYVELELGFKVYVVVLLMEKCCATQHLTCSFINSPRMAFPLPKPFSPLLLPFNEDIANLFQHEISDERHKCFTSLCLVFCNE